MRAVRIAIAALASRLPVGALGAFLVVGLIHVVVSGWVFPHPVAREVLRRKVLALTEHERPSLLVTGDSRGEWHIIPEAVARGAGLPGESAVNIAENGCTSSAVLAAYREFAGRFAAAPMMILSVSIINVNDRPTGLESIHDEMLWSIGLVDRLRIVPVGQALRDTFLPERELARRIAAYYHGVRPTVVRERGFVGKPEHDCVDPALEATRWRFSWVKERWFNEAIVDGVRWRQLEDDLHELVAAGVQVVILDSPEHPAFRAYIADTSAGAADARFHRQLRELCTRINIPLLRYDAGWCGEHDPNVLFCDSMHLNRRGAAILSELVGRDLRALMRSGRLRLP